MNRERSGVHHCPKPACPGSRTTLLNTEQRSRCSWEKSDSPKTQCRESNREPTDKQSWGKKPDFEFVVDLGAGAETCVPLPEFSENSKNFLILCKKSRRYKEYLSPSPFPKVSCLKKPVFGKFHSCPKRQQYMQMLYSLKCHMLMLTSSRHEKRLLWKHMQYCLEHKATFYTGNFLKKQHWANKLVGCQIRFRMGKN